MYSLGSSEQAVNNPIHSARTVAMIERYLIICLDSFIEKLSATANVKVAPNWQFQGKDKG